MACVPYSVVCVSWQKNKAVGMAALAPSSGITHNLPSWSSSAAAELEVPKSIPSTTPGGRPAKRLSGTGVRTQDLGQENRDVCNYTRMHAVLHGVAVPLHAIAQLGEQIARGFASGRYHHRVHAAVGHEDRGVGVGRCALSRQGVGQWQVTRQGHEACEPLGEAQTGV